MSQTDTHARYAVELENKILVWGLELHQLMHAGHWLEKQRTLLHRIKKAKAIRETIRPSTLGRSNA